MPFCFELTVIFIMLLFNAVFAAYEMALASISKSRILFLLNEKRKGAMAAAFMKDRMEASLAVVQLGITLVGAVAAAVGGSGVEETLAPYLQQTWGLSDLAAEAVSLAALIVPLTLVTIVFAELVPKVLAINNAERVVLALSPAMKYLMNIFNPLIVVLEFIVKTMVGLASRGALKTAVDEPAQRLHELKAAVSLARTSKLLGDLEEKMVLSAAQLSSRKIREIMIPIGDVFMLNSSDSLNEAFLRVHLDMHTRFPVCGQPNQAQDIQGYVNFKDILVAMKASPGDQSIRGIMRPIVRLEENVSISYALNRLMKEKEHIALVTSTQSVVSGIVTLEDIMEELVGEIEDEFDRFSTQIKPYGASWIMGGGVPMAKAAATVGISWTGDPHQTLGDWCASKSGAALVGGEYIEADGFCVTPRKFRRKKLFEAVVRAVS